MTTGALIVSACLLTLARAATVDRGVFETDDAVIVEAAGREETLRGGRQLTNAFEWPQAAASPGRPDNLAGGKNTCATPSGRSGFCVAWTVCYWTRNLPANDARLARSFGFCFSSTGHGRDNSVRKVCCPGLFASTPAPATVTTTRQSTNISGEPDGVTAQPSSAPPVDVTNWWQTTAGTTQRPSTSSAGTTVSRPTASTIPPVSALPPDQVTGWWQTTAAASATTTSATTTTTSATTTTTTPTTTTTTSATTSATGSATTSATTTRPTTTAWWETTTVASVAALAKEPSEDFSACGTKSKNAYRIVGGNEAVPGEFPWIAGIFDGSRQFCGGSLIDRNHILTAAHCVAHITSARVRRLVIRLGDHDISTPDDAPHDEYHVARVIRHRGFSELTLYNDVALLALTEPVTYRDNIRPVCLPEGDDNYTSEAVTVAGWGTLADGAPQPDKLQKVRLKVWKNADCDSSYGTLAPGGIIRSMLCASRDGKDACSGDSGGPLMIVEGGLVYQVGVVSWGIGCAKPEYPGVYTRVTSLRDWIERNRKAY
ncbi:serine proteinase stubble-like isoform X3 [Pollicipes pollicipes]|uniref:serine proteinase stubble-like isoform X3 n=1 Tax=Pollicipes pollicipes TaxID=41117 RepID=UPI0018859CE6|nr:serine proteinase stubble-like isoform X3 [Pollicipes pollicipes]